MALPSALLLPSCLALVRFTRDYIDTGQSREAHQLIYNGARWFSTIMTMELWSWHWKIDWFVEVPSMWLVSEFLLWAAGQMKIVSIVKRLPRWMVWCKWVSGRNVNVNDVYKIFHRRRCELYLLRDLLTVISEFIVETFLQVRWNDAFLRFHYMTR